MELFLCAIYHLCCKLIVNLVATYIVSVTQIIVGDILYLNLRHILSSNSIYCRLCEIFTLRLLLLATIHTKVFRISGHFTF